MVKHGKKPYLECSGKGDKRFSAFRARINEYYGHSIEELYQSSKFMTNPQIGKVPVHKDWFTQKGEPALNPEKSAILYSRLWDKYIEENPNLLKVLLKAKGVSDVFGQPGHVCQATELWRIRTKYRRRLDVSGKRKSLDKIKKCTIRYFTKKGYSLHAEIGVRPWGARRADFLGVTMKGKLVVVETKSSVADYAADCKMQEYLDHCDKAYLVMHKDHWEKCSKTQDKRIGVLVLPVNEKKLTCVRPARTLTLVGNERRRLIQKLAWRGGTYYRGHTS